MFNPVRSRFSLAVGALLAMAAMPAAAGPSLEDTLALSMSKGLRDRMFWNLSVVSTKTKTKSEEPRDQFEGGVVSIADLVAMRNAMAAGQADLDPNSDLYKINAAKLANVYSYGVGNAISALDLLEASLVADYGFTPRSGTTPGNAYIGTPKGILAKAGDPSATVALSVGYYLDDGQHWAVEALVLGAPLRAKVYGAGTNDRGEPNQLVGKELINTKMLPPLAKFGYYFGDRSWPVRPYLGVAAMYAIFFDTKATDFFNEYQGGKTSVSIKNSFGVGPFVGLESGASDSGWRVGFSVGRIKLKTEATLVTRNTLILSGADVLKDYGTNTVNAINIGEDTLGPFGNTLAAGSGVVPFPNGLTTELMKDLAAYKQTQGGDGSLGTFVRKQKTELSNTIFMLNVGRSF
ncbi:OmpW/AlkL family protein [Aquabacterium sp.]|uniref:OmpW/AlkL family protein n=1 Tax=Aquabacterium sp. TaxID=1872578 RepID=UPI003BB0C2F8